MSGNYTISKLFRFFSAEHYRLVDWFGTITHVMKIAACSVKGEQPQTRRDVLAQGAHANSHHG